MCPEPPKICRLCLVPKLYMLTLPLLNQRYRNRFATMFESITSTPFQHIDGYSQQICKDCESKMHVAVKIREDFLRADDWWKMYVENLSSANHSPIEFEKVEVSQTLISENDLEPTTVAAEVIIPDAMTSNEARLAQQQLSSLKTHQEVKTVDKIKKLPKRRIRRKPMFCDICMTKRNLEVSFDYKNVFKKHMKGHINVCKICTDCFFSKTDLQEHQKWCFPIKRNECNWCDAKMNKNFREHVLEHHPDAVWPECEKCGAKFPHKIHLTHHWKNHLMEKRFKCTYCEKAFTKRDYLTHHERVHTGEKPYKCDFCATAFSSYTSLAFHINTHSKTHDTSKFRFYKRKEKTTTKKRVINKRTETKEKISKVQHKCHFCTKLFKDLQSLEVHTRIHSQKNRPFVCKLCESSFACAANLRRHHRIIHVKHFQFECTLCHKTFIEKWQLTGHMKQTHLRGEQNLKCNLCSSKFKSKHTIKYHVNKWHKSEKEREGLAKLWSVIK